jgi:hypothetical protein
MGGGDRADAVGHARAGGQHRQAGPAGELGGRLGGEHGGLLVSDIDQAHRRVGLDGAVIEREHVPAGQGEHLLDTVLPGHRDRQPAAVAFERGRGVGGGFAHGRVLLAGGPVGTMLPSPRPAGVRGPDSRPLPAEDAQAPDLRRKPLDEVLVHLSPGPTAPPGRAAAAGPPGPA